MIFGIGSDIVQIDRIADLIARNQERFLERCFSVEEIEAAKRYGGDNEAGRIAYYAKRFAAKEAFVKAVGTGFRKGINFKDISVLNDDQGKPELFLSDSAKQWLEEKIAGAELFVSLSDDYPVAHAMVVISCR
jgi:holo-[acyl-carrier protein] synthase